MLSYAVGAVAVLGTLGTRYLFGRVGVGNLPQRVGARRLSVDHGNFHAIYRDPALRPRFLNFLTHVFQLYPQDELHTLISDAVRDSKDDQQTYSRIERELPRIEPLLGSLRYALPALRKQQAEMARQTVQLLGTRKRFDGYLELGSEGRYLSALLPHIQVNGPIYTSSTKAPDYGLEAIIDRGQIGRFGTHLPMNGYQPLASAVQPHSLQLVTVYIGFHHCPIDLRESYLASIRAAMAPGATLILRDHDVSSPQLAHLVGLAHDVFNVGTQQPWSVNERELRNFYPLEFIVNFLTRHGFAAQPGRLLQAGDPTQNTLLTFTKV
jgi:hypothetical protein